MASLSFRGADEISKELMKAIQEENTEVVEKLSQEVIDVLKSKMTRQRWTKSLRVLQTLH